MKKQIISWNMIIDGLRRIKVASIIYAALIVLVQLIIPFLSSLSDRNVHSVDVFGNYVPELLTSSELAMMLSAIPFIMAPVLVLIVFYPMDKRGASDFYHSLPYTRTCIFLSWTVSVIIVTFSAILGGMLLIYMAFLPFQGLYSLSLNGLGDVIFSLLSASLFAIAAVETAMTITGTWLSNMAASLLIMFLPRFIMYFIRTAIIDSMPILTSRFLVFFDPSYNVFVGRFCTVIFNGLLGRFTPGNALTDNIGPDTYTLVLALALIAAALILFNRRNSETAGQSAPNRILQAAIRIAITFTISIVGTVLIIYRDNDVTVIVVIYLLALIAFFAYEIITTHKWKNLVKSLPSLLVVAGLNIAVFLVIVISKNTILGRYIPAEKIESVRIADVNAYNIYDEYFALAANDIEIRDEEVYEIVSDRLSEAIDALKQGNYDQIAYGFAYPYLEGNYRTPKLVAIKTKGETVWRTLMFSMDDMLKIVDADISEAYKDQYMQLPDPVFNTMEVALHTGFYSYPLSGSDTVSLTLMKQILDSLQKEINQAGFEKWFRYLNYYGDMNENDINSCTLRYYVNTTGSIRVYVPITEEMFPETYRLIVNCMCDNADYSIADEFVKMAKEALDDPETMLHFDISMGLYHKDGADDIRDHILSADTWNGKNDDARAIIYILENCLKNGTRPDADGFVMVNYNWYNDEDSTAGWENLIVPLPVNTDLLAAFRQ